MSFAAIPLALALALVAATAPSDDDAGSTVAAEDDTARAKQAFRAGKAAAAEHRWQAAIEQFETALALRPAPSLHYNIAVCHHNLMLETPPDSEDHERHRRAAVDAYDRYLAEAPDAADRESVEQAIDSLGGRPTSDEWVIERIEPDSAPAPAIRDEDEGEADAPAGPAAATPTATTPSSTERSADPYRIARVGAFVPVGIVSPLGLSRSTTMRMLPEIGLGLRGGGFVTKSRYLNLGGELWLAGQPVSLDSDISLVTGALSFVGEFAHPIADNRVEVGGGGGLGLAVQSLRYSGTTSIPCPVSDKSLSTRGGLLLSGRLVLSTLLGAKRRHELSLRITPGLAVYSDGRRGDDETMMCDTQPHGFQSVGLDRRAALVMTIDLGYAPRF